MDIKIDYKIISNFTRPYIIAEIGINHNGSISLAKKMIDKAKESKADAVKFQFFQKNKLINPFIKEGNNITNMLSKYFLNPSQIKELKIYSEKKNIDFLVTPFDIDGVKILERLGQKFYKIASGDINNFMLLEAVAKTKKPVILSTGASTINEVKKAVNFIKTYNDKIIILHCVSLYPTKINKINLWSIPFLQKKFNVPVGLSDHTKGIKIPVLASLLGTAVIEKHFTLNKKLKGPDHKFSITPEELKKLREKIDEILLIAGNFEKKPYDEELEGNYWGRRSFVAIRDIKENEKFNAKNIEPLRPAKGISASKYFYILNKKAKHFVKKGSFIFEEDLK